MPECPKCREAYLEGESHTCAVRDRSGNEYLPVLGAFILVFAAVSVGQEWWHLPGGTLTAGAVAAFVGGWIGAVRRRGRP
jgi:hypothetical protein